MAIYKRRKKSAANKPRKSSAKGKRGTKTTRTRGRR